MKERSFNKDACVETLSSMNKKVMLMAMTSNHSAQQVPLTRYRAVDTANI